ncbi:cobaltochelatase subunit CobN [Oryzifoliimicrobium ureilyticus]|uniref:cobaltochelatase subunit CobN n=1 Tax=Oryzifoliimicrobium ureilyticus TaxID=3113724 RepID=UPI00307666CB
MHLLLAQKGTIAEGEEAVDLGQSPGDVLFLSAADTELAAVAAAFDPDQCGFSLRLANLNSLRHPMSVDTYVERTARHAKLIVVRALGGASYFRYILEALFACAQRSGAQIAVLPGDSKPDAGVAPYSSMASKDVEALWAYMIEGGDENTRGFLAYLGSILKDAERPTSAAPLIKAGIWWPGRGIVSFEDWDKLSLAASAANNRNCRSVAGIAFYRAHVQSGAMRQVEALVEALLAEGLLPLPIFAYSLKDSSCVDILREVLQRAKPTVMINTTAFAISAPGRQYKPTVLDENDAVVLQAIFSSSSRENWHESSQGLSARDLGMHVALPEVDGRVLARAISFKAAARYDSRVESNIVTSVPDQGRMAYTAKLAAAWATLRAKKLEQRKIGLILANYPNRDGRLGNGVGLDTPAAAFQAMQAMFQAGYALSGLPDNPGALINQLQEGPTNADRVDRKIRCRLPIATYREFIASLPPAIIAEIDGRWGPAEKDPNFLDGAFPLSFLQFGNLLVGVQPPRGYEIDPKESYHSPDLVPPHAYLAFYAYLRGVFQADAVIHMGKHGNLEWLPGKALALSETCYPEAVLGPMPHLYPFIVNDPGEGTQAKRRSSAVIIDHLTPPLTRAESYGALKNLESLVDEYYDAAGGDPRRLRLLQRQILDLVADIGLDRDAGIGRDDSETESLRKLDAYLCDLKEMQIRDGLHIFGVSPEGRLLTDLCLALARVPRGSGEGADASLQRAIAQDAFADARDWKGVFDPLDCDMAASWTGPRPDILAKQSEAVWRTAGDTVERIELLAAELVAGELECPEGWARTRAVLKRVEEEIKPSLVACGRSEIEALLRGLDGRSVAPGPSGAPTRGRPDVLPTGRNFYSVDSRAVPTPAAYELGRKSAEMLIRRYVQDHGEWPVSFGLTAWGTANMRTGGDDIAQALALIGAKPVWDMDSRRVTGYEILPGAVLGRPRVDVTLRISGFFRDAFPEQIALLDRAIRAVGSLDEDDGENPIAMRMRLEAERLQQAGLSEGEARKRAGYRIFGSKPGGYGAGLQTLIDTGTWKDRSELGEAYLVAGSYAYGASEEGVAERGIFEEQIRSLQAVVQNQDNREHDILDSDEYYQFEGGMAVAAERLKGDRPVIYHNDHSRPEKPVIRSLEEEIGRVVRGRVINPKWIDGVRRHGYKGASEITATVDYLFAFAATTGAVSDHHFESVYDAFVRDETVRDFMLTSNPAAFQEMTERLCEAIDRGLWHPRSNSARFDLEEASGRQSRRNDLKNDLKTETA